MFKTKDNLPLSRDYFVFASIIIAAIFVLSILIGVMIFNSQMKDLSRTLETESERIESAIGNVFDNTNRISIYMGKQIAEHGSSDLNFIYDLFQKTSGSQYKASKFLSWSLFDWVDDKNRQLINSQHGIAKNPPDMSHRQYTTRCRENPWSLQVSRPAIGMPSGQWVIPAGTGITDAKGNYLGAIVVGYNIPNFTQQVSDLVSNSRISYAILDDELNVVMQSSDNELDVSSDFYRKKLKDWSLFPASVGKLAESFVQHDIKYTQYRKVAGYPYVILSGFSQSYTSQLFFSTLFPRIVELVGMGVFFLIILYFFRHFIVTPITQLSNTADRIARGEWIKKVPRTPTYETTNLAKQLIYLQSYVRRIQRIDQRLFAAKKDAERANRAKSDFLANMSHELRTPLNAIIGYSEMIKSEILGPVENRKYKEYAYDIHSSGIHLLSLINDILDISKAESGKFEIIEEVVDVRAVVDESVRLLMELAAKKGVTIDIRASARLPLMRADKLRLKQIVINLLSNAVKFSPDDGRIEVTLKEKHGLVLVVEDHGIGIAEKDIPKILEKFGHIKSAVRQKHEGTGLGLWLTQMLVEAHGATLSIESELEKGTKVTVHFPEESVIPRVEELVAAA